MKKYLLKLTIILLSLSSCNMDGFLFNTETIDSYKLPGNNIPDSLIEQVVLQSNGNKIYGYWISSNGEHPVYTILYCHGNKHNIDEYWDRVILMHEMGVNVFIFDYQGFGMSEGESTEKNMYSNAEAALNYVMNERNIIADSLCLYGYSLGNVASIYLAAEKVNPDCLIAEAPFASANSLTQGAIGLDIPALWLTEGEFNNADKIKKINTRFFLLHGEDDDFVRYKDNGKKVFENAHDPKIMELVPKALHTNIPEILGFNEYKKLIKNWMFNTFMIK